MKKYSRIVDMVDILISYKSNFEFPVSNWIADSSKSYRDLWQGFHWLEICSGHSKFAEYTPISSKFMINASVAYTVPRK